MIKTQIQIPDALYREAKRVAADREMSLAEVLRRGLEYIIGVYPPLAGPRNDWKLPGPFASGVKADPFANPDWRYELNARTAAQRQVREKPAGYRARKSKARA